MSKPRQLAIALELRDAALSMIARDGRTEGGGCSVWKGQTLQAMLETPFGAPPRALLPGVIEHYWSKGKLVGARIIPPSQDGALPWRLSVWAADSRGRLSKRLSIEWDDKGDPPPARVVSFRRGAWEQELRALAGIANPEE